MEVVVACSDERFVRAVDILVRKPHATIKSLSGCTLKGFTPTGTDGILPVQNRNELTLLNSSAVIFRRLVQKKPSVKLPDYDETIVWRRDVEILSVSFEGPEHAFQITFHPENGRLTLTVDRGATDTISNSYFQPLLKWCRESGELNPTLRSNGLVDLSAYRDKYVALKDRYSGPIIKTWNESTDPEKFVHEDLALAAYLILLWESEGVEKVRFLDLGCGNGLLTHILTSEGFKGTGLDLRKRKIWDTFGPHTDLQVSTIVPSSTKGYSSYNWLIGNHSDELTPWIPVMATLSSMDAKFFVLPCCPFEFHKKFARQDHRLTIYRDYLNYVKEVGEKCGFVMEEDRLKIPSTKRICFVGRSRAQNSPVEWETIKTNIAQDVIYAERCPTKRQKKKLEHLRRKAPWGDDNEGSQKIIGNQKRPKGVPEIEFTPRSTQIMVQNCTQLPRSLISSIVDMVVRECLRRDSLLKQHPIFQALDDDRRATLNPDWNMGGKVSISLMASPFMMSEEQRAAMKKQNGGLQTLLRNHNFIFIVEKDQIRLRCHGVDPESAGKKQRRSEKKAGHDGFRKRKLCWFHQNHPEGCPIISSTNCSWAHGEVDLVSGEIN